MKKLDSTITLLNDTLQNEQLNNVYQFEEFVSLQNWKMDYISRLESYRDMLQSVYDQGISKN